MASNHETANPAIGRIEEIGQEEGLSGLILHIFVEYITRRGWTDKTGYSRNWARRFARGEAWDYSDGAGRYELVLIIGSRFLAKML